MWDNGLMGEKKIPDTIGVCVKDLAGTVCSQDKMCSSICGDQLNKKCNKGCMLNYKYNSSYGSFEKGVFLLDNINSEGQIIDAVLINDGQTLTTLLIKKSEILKERLELFKKYFLSAAEINVMSKYLMGYSNLQIASELFISIRTLRTHLNNIYKKIPLELKQELRGLRKKVKHK
jgi:DNA-binding CsgD family transcriptional regulator